MSAGLLRPGLFLSVSTWHNMAAADEMINGIEAVLDWIQVWDTCAGLKQRCSHVFSSLAT